MKTLLPAVAAEYIRATNAHDSTGFIACFAESACVQDAGREYRGREEIKTWSDREIIDAQVTLEVLDVTAQDGDVRVTTKVEGNFDRTGLPDPLLIEHRIKHERGKIVELECQLAVDGTRS